MPLVYDPALFPKPALVMLSAIVAVTLLVPDVDAVARAYDRALEYRTVERGELSLPAARLWGAEQLAGREYRILQPSSLEPVYLRLVETAAEPPPAMKTIGWNATEILVEDPKALAPRLEAAGSAFRVIGPPAPLEMNPAVVAMQALGPADELLYFTHIPPGRSRFNLGSATSFVDRVFIVVLGVDDLRRTLDYYSVTFGVEVTEPVATRVDVLAAAWGLPAGHSFEIGIARLAERFLIEVDAYPEGTARRLAKPGELPPGMAMVSFEVPSLDRYASLLLTPPAAPQGLPYAGRRAGVLRGPNGEYIELIEATVAGGGTP